MTDETKTTPKVVKMSLFNDENPIVETLKELLVLAESGNLENFIFAGFDREDRIVIAKPNTNVIEDQHLVSFLQSYATMRVINEAWLDEEIYTRGMYDDEDNDDDDE